MKWITRENANVERIACPWLIKRFIDPNAVFEYVPPHTDPSSLDGIPFDMPGVRLGHRDGKCSFESILEDYQLQDDPGLMFMGQIIHGADIPMDAEHTSESLGLRAIAFGFMYKYGKNDHEKLHAQLEMYDALYLYCQEKARTHSLYTSS